MHYRVLFTALVLFICTWISSVQAAHLVGGELEMTHISGTIYRIRMNQYFDVQGSTTNTILQEPSVTVAFFERNTHIRMRNLVLPRMTAFIVPYTNPECFDASFQTYQVIYEAEINLDIENYTSENGYYIIWDRCCRNNTITNITNPGGTGQTFYMEFAALYQNNQHFVNSSPGLFPPIGDYACLNETFFFNFAGQDVDGDSLVYSLSVPMSNTSPQNILPNPPTAASYTPVNFQQGYSRNNMIPGSPALSISRDGFIVVKPDRTGLFVFAIKIEEFRNGVKIGEVRRDYQLLVAGNCNPGQKPRIFTRFQDGALRSGLVNVDFDKANEDRCIEILITDPDEPEVVTNLFRPVNFVPLEANFSPNVVATLQGRSDTLRYQFCFPICPDFTDEPYLMDILALDDACTFPLMDTLRLRVRYIDFDQRAPYFENPSILRTASPGQVVNTSIVGLDNDNDPLDVRYINEGLDLSVISAQFEQISKQNGRWEGRLRWSFDCENPIYDSLKSIPLRFVVLDKNPCATSLTDTLTITLSPQFPDNNKPQVSINSLNAGDTLSANYGDLISFVVNVSDADMQDPLSLTAKRDLLNFEEYKISFNDRTGTASLNSTFSWQVPCNKFITSQTRIIPFTFIGADTKSCRSSLSDSITVYIRLLPIQNRAPQIEVFDLPESDTLRVQAGTNLKIQLESIDDPADSVVIQLLDLHPIFYRNNLTQSIKNAKARATAEINFAPNCNLIPRTGNSVVYPLTIQSFDKNDCKGTLLSDKVIYIEIYNEDLIPKFQPVNAITPNGDAFNETFYLHDLPDDNCTNAFVDVTIINRWGNQVYYSQNRDFQWDAKGEPSGVYFYVIRFTNHQIKSSLHVLY